MSKIPNWKRKKLRETGDMYRSTEYYWQNEVTSNSVKVDKIFISEEASRADFPNLEGSAFIYVIEGPKGRIGKEGMDVNYYTNKEKARKKAVEWTNNHPDA